MRGLVQSVTFHVKAVDPNKVKHCVRKAAFIAQWNTSNMFQSHRMLGLFNYFLFDLNSVS